MKPYGMRHGAYHCALCHKKEPESIRAPGAERRRAREALRGLDIREVWSEELYVHDSVEGAVWAAEQRGVFL